MANLKRTRLSLPEKHKAITVVESGNKEKVTVALQSAEVSNKKEKRERLTEW